jgi:ribosomal protein S18 acetylase RimI-like enzyme
MIEVSEYKGLTLGPVTQLVAQTAADEKWLEDETENRQQGFGKGYEGQANAIEGLLHLFERNHLEADFGVIGVFLKDEPSGFAAVDLHPDQKLADLYLFISPNKRGQGLGSAVLNYLLGIIYANGSYRVQVDILKINKGGLHFLRERGFTWESTKKAAYWMDRNVYDIAHLRLLRPDWYELQKED